MKATQVKFKKWDCAITKGRYSNGRTALQLIDAGGDLIAKATVNVPDEILKNDEVIIKDWSENEGMYEALLKAGIISKEIREISIGFVTAKICKLLI